MHCLFLPELTPADRSVTRNYHYFVFNIFSSQYCDKKVVGDEGLRVLRSLKWGQVK